MKTVLTSIALVTLSASAATAQDIDDAQMRALTQNAVQGISGDVEPTSQVGQTDLSSLVSQAINEGQSDAYLEALIDEAVESGTVEVPEAMVSTDGAIDTKTLLASLVNQSLQGAAANDALLSEASGASVEEAKPRLHTVARGESLAGIALQYYGDATKFETIFAANRNTIDRPSLIRVGQVIQIP